MLKALHRGLGALGKISKISKFLIEGWIPQILIFIL